MTTNSTLAAGLQSANTPVDATSKVPPSNNATTTADAGAASSSTSASGPSSAVKTARIIHTIWYIRALARYETEVPIKNSDRSLTTLLPISRSNRKKEGREIFEYVLSAANKCGILSDSIDVHSGELWGNFPMTTVMGGILQCAQVLSKKWMEVL